MVCAVFSRCCEQHLVPLARRCAARRSLRLQGDSLREPRRGHSDSLPTPSAFWPPEPLVLTPAYPLRWDAAIYIHIYIYIYIYLYEHIYIQKCLFIFCTTNKDTPIHGWWRNNWLYLVCLKQQWNIHTRLRERLQCRCLAKRVHLFGVCLRQKRHTHPSPRERTERRAAQRRASGTKCYT